jgi:hypothetical protein
MHSVVDYTLASPQLQIYVKAMAVIFVDGPSPDIAPDNPYSIFLNKIVRLAMCRKHGIHCCVTVSAIARQGNLIQHWVIGIVGRHHKFGTQSSIRLQIWYISGSITK